MGLLFDLVRFSGGFRGVGRCYVDWFDCGYIIRLVWSFLNRASSGVLWFDLGVYFGNGCTWFVGLIVQLLGCFWWLALFVFVGCLTPKSLWYFTWMCLRLSCGVVWFAGVLVGGGSGYVLLC